MYWYDLLLHIVTSYVREKQFGLYDAARGYDQRLNWGGEGGGQDVEERMTYSFLKHF